MHVLLLSLALGCHGTGDTTVSDDTDVVDTDTTGDTGDTDAAADGTRTLDNCGGSVADDVPAFYAKYFVCSDLSVDGGELVVHTSSLPPHKSYYWGASSPNYEDWDDRGGDYAPNQNTLSEQDVNLRIPLSPVAKGITVTPDMVDLTVNTSAEEYSLGPTGLGLDGVALFNAVAAVADDILNEQWTFDEWMGHADNHGAYHHHSAFPDALVVLQRQGLVTNPTVGEAEIELYGVMCDGTVVLGCTELDGSAVDPGDLDGQGGHVGDLVDETGTTLLAGRYHTHVCSADGFPMKFTPEIQYYDRCTNR